jgi:hypothetical protein
MYCYINIQSVEISTGNCWAQQNLFLWTSNIRAHKNKLRQIYPILIKQFVFQFNCKYTHFVIRFYTKAERYKATPVLNFIKQLSTTPRRYMGLCMCSPTILDFGTRWGWVVSYTTLCPWGKWPRYPLNRRLGWPQSRSGGRRGVEKKSLTPAGNWTSCVQLTDVIIPTELFHMR